MSVATRTVTIEDPVGIHARPASEFSQAAMASNCTVTIAKGEGAPVSANSILSIMGLGITKGDSITITVDGNDAENVAAKLVEVVTKDE